MARFFALMLMVTVGHAQSFNSFLSQLESAPLQQRESIVEKYTSAVKSTPVIEHDSLLHFMFPAAASVVLVNGNLQHWAAPDTMHMIPCGRFSLFYRSYVVPPDARLDYQIIVDGDYILDPFNPRSTPSGYGPHSEVRMPKFVSSQYLVRRDSIRHGILDSVVLYAHVRPPLRHFTRAPRTIKVYLPPGYDTLSGLPSVYVHDGIEAIDFALLPTVIDNLIADKKIHPPIAVFIPPVERQNEYVGSSLKNFVRFLGDEVVPMIDKRYKTDTVSSSRAMMGISNGGHLSLYAVFSRPDKFGNAGGQSSAITPQLRELVERRVSERAFDPTMKIYIDCGAYDIKENDPRSEHNDFLTLNREFSDLLASHRIPHYYREVNDGHEWANWRERMPEMLMYFFGIPQ